MIEYINDKIVIIPQHKHFFSEISKKELEPLLCYLYYYYSKDSTFKDVLPSEKESLVIDLINSKYKNFDKSKYLDFIDKYENTFLSSTQKLAIALNKRIEKIIKELEKDVSIDDLEQEGKNMKALTEIFKLQDILENKIAKESKIVEGKGAKKINEFEDLII